MYVAHTALLYVYIDMFFFVLPLPVFRICTPLFVYVLVGEWVYNTTNVHAFVWWLGYVCAMCVCISLYPLFSFSLVCVMSMYALYCMSVFQMAQKWRFISVVFVLYTNDRRMLFVYEWNSFNFCARYFPIKIFEMASQAHDNSYSEEEEDQRHSNRTKWTNNKW